MKCRLGSGRISSPAGFEPATPWSEVGSANRSATRTLLWLRSSLISIYTVCNCLCIFGCITLRKSLNSLIIIIHGLKMCMWFGYNPCMNFCHFFHCPQILWKVYRQWVPCNRNSLYNFILIFMQLWTSVFHDLKMCLWFGFNPAVNFCHFSTLLTSSFFNFLQVRHQLHWSSIFMLVLSCCRSVFWHYDVSFWRHFPPNIKTSIWPNLSGNLDMSRSMIKPTKWPVLPVKTQISLIRVFAVCSMGS